MKRGSSNLIWQEVTWPRPFQPTDVLELLTHLATLSPRKQIVWEVRGSGGKVRYFIGTGRRYMKPLKAAFMSHGEIRFSDVGDVARIRRETSGEESAREETTQTKRKKLDGEEAVGVESGKETVQTAQAEVTITKQIRRTKSALSLKTERTLAVLKTALATLADTKDNETLTVQIILGESYAPNPMPDKATDPHASLLDTICGKIGAASKESLLSIKRKAVQHGFFALVRIAAHAENRNRANGLLLGLMSAFRQFETAGIRLVFSATDPKQFHEAHIPLFLPLRLSIEELAGFVLLPSTDMALAGTPGLHPKVLYPPVWLSTNGVSGQGDETGKASKVDENGKVNKTNEAGKASTVSGQSRGRCFAKSLGVNPIRLNIPVKDSLEHTVILGPTGSGKSTVMLNLALADIEARRGVLVIDPKADLVNDILARIPKDRTDDVVVVDPSDACPVGLNPFVLSHHAASPSLISDVILAVFKQIFKDSWGVYSQDVLSAALLTLAYVPNATLLQLPALLTDTHFRQKLITELNHRDYGNSNRNGQDSKIGDNSNNNRNGKDSGGSKNSNSNKNGRNQNSRNSQSQYDNAGLDLFWAGFEAMSRSEQRQTIAPVMNKLRQFTLRPALRNVLGQPHPKFMLSDLFDKNKIVLVPLNKGIIGAEAAKLLGSLLVGLTWTLALSRAKLPPEERQPVSVFIDELQDYLALPTDFADALAQARGLGVGFTVAHQYRSQLSPSIKAAIDTNARNKIVFGLNATDAKDMAAMAPELTTEDFMALPRHHVYASLQSGGRGTGWISGKTLNSPPPKSPLAAVELKAQSQARYGQEPTEPTGHEAITTATHSSTEPSVSLTLSTPIGRIKADKAK